MLNAKELRVLAERILNSTQHNHEPRFTRNEFLEIATALEHKADLLEPPKRKRKRKTISKT